MSNIEFSRNSKRTDAIKAEAEAANKAKELKDRAIRHIASIPEGRIFLHILMDECGFNKPSIYKDAQGSIDVNAIIINEAIRGLYLQIRNAIPKDKLREIEFLDLREESRNMIREDKGE